MTVGTQEDNILVRVMDLVMAADAAPLTQHKQGWKHSFGVWIVYVNGQREAIKMDGHTIMPFHILAMRDGWPAIYMAASGGGEIAGGEHIEREFFEALGAEVTQLKEADDA